MDLFNIPAFRPEARPRKRLAAKPLRQRPPLTPDNLVPAETRHPVALGVRAMVALQSAS
jgi:hypothetical protein